MPTATSRSIDASRRLSPTAERGPAGRYGLRNLYRFVTNELSFLRGLADTYGDLVPVKIAGMSQWLVSHPDDIEALTVKHARVMGRDAYIVVLQRALGLGLLTSDGELWKRQRKLMSQAFTPKRISGYGAAMVRVTERSLSSLAHGSVVNIHEEMSRVALEVVADVLFGASVSAEEVRKVRHSMEDVNEFFARSPEAIFNIPSWVPTARNRRFAAAIRAIDEVVYGIIAKRRRGEKRDDLLDVLLAAQDDESGTGMTDKQLRDEVITLFLAGHETTALTLAHTLYLLSKHPAIERRLHAEIAAVLGDRPPTSEHVGAKRSAAEKSEPSGDREGSRLPFTEQVLKESMRLYPPAWTIGREATEDVEVGGVTIPKGAQILMSQWVVHRDARWFPNPEGFDPDRWEPSRAASIPKMAYFPFGAGPRVCIGQHFAMLEATLILAMLVQRYRFELLPGEKLELDPSVTLRQRGPGLRARVTVRKEEKPQDRTLPDAPRPAL